MLTAPLGLIDVRIDSIVQEAREVLVFALSPQDGNVLPPFTAGAHIDVHLPAGQLRSYSLVNPQTERHRYVIAVRRDAAGQGGSRFMHASLRAGDRLTISAPRNTFPLVEDAPHVVFIAGGIGITPLWGMIQRLEDLAGSWELHYCARTKSDAAFRASLEALEVARCGRVRFTFDHEPDARMLDIDAVVARASPDAHLYCCGPLSMLTAFEAAAASRPADRVHVEYFVPRSVAATSGGFLVELARTRRSVRVPAGQTILDALLDAGVDVPCSCQTGVCGTCETRVLAGTPDHRDSVLTAAERASNDTMMICCSGCVGDRLVLDL